MKKMLVLTVAAFILSIAFARCAKQTAETPNTGDKTVIVSDEPAESSKAETSSSLLAGKESESSDSNNKLEQSSESTSCNESQSKTAAPSDTPATSQITEAPAPEQKTTLPPVTEKPNQETQPQTPPTTEKPAPTKPPVPTFEVSEYVDYAKSYGQDIGLSLDSTATAWWDDPLSANVGCNYLKRDLKDRLDWYKASGYTGFWVWSEDLGNGAYQIYIGYA